MRTLLLVNPKATTTNERTRDVLIRALGAAVDLSVEETARRGHATELAATAHARGFEAVAVLGGDGTMNETVNGLLGAQPDQVASGRPALMIIPGGSANVFARALGLPNNPVEATGAVLDALRDDRRRTIGLGQAVWHDEVSGPDPGADGGPDHRRSRYFTFCAGLGYDAEVIRAVEGLRSTGRRALPALYVNTAVRHFFVTDRRHAALRLRRPNRPDEEGIFLAIVSNTAPWTYAGPRPINPTPLATFETGLDLLGLRKLNLPTMAALVRQIVGERHALPTGRHLVQIHDEAEFTLVATRPMAFQLDGDYLGEHEWVIFRAIPDALQVLV
ncbi:diacylglycerol kinase family protein [Sphaerimonospora mesophila]|uniref:diacylglycerol/lipid kinase family protein n=1 Tax=Sphaerimonospora mesophila TaxID=37483 RepID=UPI0006E449F8